MFSEKPCNCKYNNEIRQDLQIHFHQESRMAVIPYSSQAGGFFSKLDSEVDRSNPLVSKSPFYTKNNLMLFSKIKNIATAKQCPISHVVLGYLLSQKIPTIPVFGSSSMQQLIETIQAADCTLSEDEMRILTTT